jgi:hypothetical protein
VIGSVLINTSLFGNVRIDAQNLCFPASRQDHNKLGLVLTLSFHTATMPFFQGATNVDASHSTFNNVAGNQINTYNDYVTNNTNSFNTTNRTNTNSFNDSSQRQVVKGG